MKNPIIEGIKERRSIRKFKDKSIPEDKIEEILEAARWTPSGLNNQPWKFEVIRDENEIKQISECSKYSETIKESKALIVVYLDENNGYDRTKDLQGIGACCQNIWLAIHDIGLGAVWNGEILNHKKCVDDILETPNNLELMAIFCIGYPDESCSSTRKPLNELII